MYGYWRENARLPKADRELIKNGISRDHGEMLLHKIALDT